MKNFKEWLKNIEEGTQVKNRPSAGSVTDRSNLLGASAYFGRPDTQLPISLGADNQAVAALAAGVGSGIRRSLEKSGAVVDPPPHILPKPPQKDTGFQHGSLPLQLPLDIESQRYFLSQSASASFWSVMQIINDPQNDPRVLKIEDKSTSGRFPPPNYEDDVQVYLAKTFTRTLIHIMIYNEMKKQGLDRKYDLTKAKLEAEDVKNGVLVCVFSFKTNSKLPPNAAEYED